MMISLIRLVILNLNYILPDVSVLSIVSIHPQYQAQLSISPALTS